MYKTLCFVAVTCFLLTACGAKNNPANRNNVVSSAASATASSTASSVAEVFSFRALTPNDLSQVTTAWAQRDLSAKNVSIAYEYNEADYNVKIYEHTIGTKKHYGAVISPTKIFKNPLPVEVAVDGLNQLDPSITLENNLRYYGSNSILVVPTFRGRTLKYKGLTFFAEGDFCDAYDGATDDTIALLNVVEATTPEANMKKVLVTGYSRGGNVALLMAERDARVKEIIAGAGPVDFYRQQVSSRYGSQYQCQFIAGKTVAESRQRILASSPLHFTILPTVEKVYLFQGAADQTVLAWNAEEMNAHLLAQGTNVSYYLYEGFGHGDIWSNQNFINTWNQVHAEFKGVVE